MFQCGPWSVTKTKISLVSRLLGHMKSVLIHLSTGKKNRKSTDTWEGRLVLPWSTPKLCTCALGLAPGAGLWRKSPGDMYFKKRKRLLCVLFIRGNLAAVSDPGTGRKEHPSLLQELQWIVDVVKRWWKGCCHLCMLYLPHLANGCCLILNERELIFIQVCLNVTTWKQSDGRNQAYREGGVLLAKHFAISADFIHCPSTCSTNLCS